MDEKKDETSVFENDSVIQSVLIMAIPTIISQMITVLYNYADTIFVGQLNDPKQVAAIALAFPLTIIITALGNLWGIGGGSTISRALGKANLQEAKHAAAFSFYGAVILTGICCMMAFVMGDAFGYMLGASSADLDFTNRYIFWMFIIGAVPSVLSQVLAHFARSLGFAKAAGIGLTLGGILKRTVERIVPYDGRTSTKADCRTGAFYWTAICTDISFVGCFQWCIEQPDFKAWGSGSGGCRHSQENGYSSCEYCRWNYARFVALDCIQLWGRKKGKNKKIIVYYRDIGICCHHGRGGVSGDFCSTGVKDVHQGCRNSTVCNTIHSQALPFGSFICSHDYNQFFFSGGE